MKKEMVSRWTGLFKRGEVLFLLVLFSFFLFLLRECLTYPSDTRSFPGLVILGTLILLGVLLITQVCAPSLKRAVAFPDPEGEKGSPGAWKTKGRFYRGWLSILISLVAGFLLGFVFIIPASFISYTLLLGRKSALAKVVVLSIITGAVVYLLFNRFLGIPMMRGALWRL